MLQALGHMIMSRPLISGIGYTGSDIFDGDLDDLGIWSRALSSDEVYLLYADGTFDNFELQLQLYMPFDSTSAESEYRADTIAYSVALSLGEPYTPSCCFDGVKVRWIVGLPLTLSVCINCWWE